MFPILHPLQEHQKLPVFLVALVSIPGEGAENSPKHKAIRYNGKNTADGPLHKSAHQAHNQRSGQNHRIELIRAIAAHHKLPKAHCQLHAKLPEPIAKTIHKQITLQIIDMYIIV